FAGFYGYLDQVVVDWGFMAGFTGVAIVGIVIGTALVSRIPQRALQRAFAVFLLVMGSWLLYQNRGVLTRTASPAAGNAPVPPATTSMAEPRVAHDDYHLDAGGEPPLAELEAL